MSVRSIGFLSILFVQFLWANESPLLNLINGDRIPGRIVELEQGKSLIWNTHFFEKPLSVPSDQIRTILYPDTSNTLPSGKGYYLFKTISGNTLHGTLNFITPDKVGFSSPRHGDVVLERISIASILNLDDYWKYSVTNTGNWNQLFWEKDDSGNLSTSLRNVELSGTLLLEEKFKISLKMSWEKEPRFAFRLNQEGGALKPGVKIALETWEDNLVILLNNNFSLVRKLPQTTPFDIDYSLYINPAASSVEVIDCGGNSLARIKGIAGSNYDKFGFTIQNQGTEVKLSNLDFINWKSESPEEVKESPGFISTDGSWVDGYLHTFVPEKISLFVTGRPIMETEAIRSIHLNKITKHKPTIEGNVTLRFNDLTLLDGVLTKLEDNTAFLKIPASTAEVSCKLDGLKFIKFHSLPKVVQPAKETENDLLTWESGEMKGRLIPNASLTFPLSWKPYFSNKPIPLKSNQSFSIKRKNADPSLINTTTNNALVHFRNRMELPASIESFSENILTIHSPFLPHPREYATSQLRAIRFPLAEDLMTSPGKTKWSLDQEFADNYRIEEGKLRIFKKIEIKGSPAPDSSLLLELKDIRNTDFNLGITVHEKETQEKERHRNRLSRIYIDKRRNYCSITKILPTNTSSSSFSARKENMEIEFRFENTLNFKVEGRHESLPMEDVDHVVLYIEPKKEEVIVHSPELIHSIRAIPSPSELGKTLYLPRLSAKSPPPNIIIAPNGDTLRGYLNNMNQRELEFTSMKRTLKIPTNRCSTILWMPPLDSPPPPIIAQGNIRITITNGTVIPMELKSYKDGMLLGDSSDIGECQVPFESATEFHFWQSGYLEPLDTFDHWNYTVNQPKPLDN